MGTEEKFSAVLSIIEEHNSAVGGPGSPGFIDQDAFVKEVKIVGGTSESRLKRFSYEDILACMRPAISAVGGVRPTPPTVLAKEIASIFRGKTDDKPRPVGSNRANRMTVDELVRALDPEDHTNAVGRRLKNMSRGEPFVVFGSGRIVDNDATIQLLEEVKQGYDGRETFQTSDGIKQVYKVGSLPDTYADENPLYPGRALRPDGACDQTGRSWDGVQKEVRQLIRVAVDVGDLNVNIETAHNVIDLAVGKDPLFAIRKRYNKAAVDFDKLEKVAGLPQLKMPMSVVQHSGSSISSGKKVRF